MMSDLISETKALEMVGLVGSQSNRRRLRELAPHEANDDRGRTEYKYDPAAIWNAAEIIHKDQLELSHRKNHEND